MTVRIFHPMRKSVYIDAPEVLIIGWSQATPGYSNWEGNSRAGLNCGHQT